MNLLCVLVSSSASYVDAFLRHRFLSLLFPDGDHLVLPFPARLLRVGGLLEGLLPGVLPRRGRTQHDKEVSLSLSLSLSLVVVVVVVVVSILLRTKRTKSFVVSPSFLLWMKKEKNRGEKMEF